MNRRMPAAALAAVAALVVACGGGDPLPSARESAAQVAVAALPFASNPAAATITPVAGHGTSRFEGFSIPSGRSAFPINNTGTTVLQFLSDDRFELTQDGVTYNPVPAGGPGVLQNLALAIDDAATLTFLRRGVVPGTPEQYQFFSRAAPYTTLVPYAPAITGYSFELDTNVSGQGAMLVDASVPYSVLRFDGLGGAAQTLNIDPSVVGDTALDQGGRRPKILADGTIYVSLLNYGAQPQRYEIWRFAGPAETQNHTVAYALPVSNGALSAWGVNEAGALVVTERTSLGEHAIKTVDAAGVATAVPGTQTIDPDYYSSVFINRSGLIAAVASTGGTSQPLSQLLYVPPGGAPVAVLSTDDALNTGRVSSIAATSDMNEAGQLTLLTQIDRSPEPNPTQPVVVIVTPLFPSIGGFAPASGPVGTSVVITGKHLGGTSALSFNGSAAAFTIDSPMQITATVPAGASSGLVSLTTPAGGATSTDAFTVTTQLAPSLTGFSPGSGGVGSTVVVKGMNFNVAGTTTVRFNGVAAQHKLKGALQLTATVPAGATSGPISITTAGGSATSATDFVVVPAPAIDGFTPSSGPSGTAVTISGSNFIGVNSVLFGAAKGSFTVVSPTTIVASVPNGAKSGSRPLTVVTEGGSAVSATPFTVVK